MSKPWLSGNANGKYMGDVACSACAAVTATYKTMRLCRRCYDRVRLHGFAVGPIIGKVTGFVCIAEGCDKPIKGLNLCAAHYSWERRSVELPTV